MRQWTLDISPALDISQTTEQVMYWRDLFYAVILIKLAMQAKK